MKDLIQKAASDLASSRYAVALTGAGISVESGIPPFRGKGGLWEKIDPMEYAHIEALNRNPEAVWRVLIQDMKTTLDTAEPNDGHIGLATLERMGILKTIITQNVDGLHQKAGSRNTIEFHGSFAWMRCMRCSKRIETSRLQMHDIPPRCECSGIWRPECVFFGEEIPPQCLIDSKHAAMQCDVMLVIGTSAEVQPAAYMPVIAKHRGATIIEINPEKTTLTHGISDYIIQGKAGEILKAIVEAINR